MLKLLLALIFVFMLNEARAEKNAPVYQFNFQQVEEVKTSSTSSVTPQARKKDFGVQLVEFFFPQKNEPEDFARDGLFTSVTARGETREFKDISALELGVRKSIGKRWEGSLAYFRLEMNQEINQQDPTYSVGGVSIALERVIQVHQRWFVNPYFSYAKAQNSHFDYTGIALGAVGEYRWRLFSAGLMIFSNTYSIHQNVTHSTLQKSNLSSIYGGARFAYFF